eukprot:sb/3470078/
MLSLFVWKVISTLALTGSVYLFGLAPLLLGNSVSRAQVSLLSACSGGMLLGTTFIHLFPEVAEEANSFRCNVGIKSAYPVGELLICAGLISVMIIEQFVHEYENVLHGGGGERQKRLCIEDDDDEDGESVSLMVKGDKGHHGGHSHDGGHDHAAHFVPGHAGGWSAYVLVMALSIHSVLEGDVRKRRGAHHTIYLYHRARGVPGIYSRTKTIH